MPDLKRERGTVLYANVVFDGPTGNGQTLTIPVFNLAIVGLKPSSFMMENSGDVPFGNLIGDMNLATLRSSTLVISYPDATFASTAAITFGTVIAVGWSDTLINAFGPPTDPDWHNNPAYITMDQHFLVTTGGGRTRPRQAAATAHPAGKVKSLGRANRRATRSK